MMDLVNKGKGNNKKGLMIKTWERCRSFGGGGGSKNSNNVNNNNNISGIGRALVKRSKSWPGLQYYYCEEDYKKGRRIAPEGWFSVYVGAQKQRFVIKTEYVNHPLFKVLLEEAESEYGYHAQGPLALPCHVDIFLKLLLEMDSHHHHHNIIQKGCTFTRTTASTAYRLL